VNRGTLAPMLEILRLRGGPQELPADAGALVSWIGISMISGILVAAPLYGFITSLFLSALDLIVLWMLVLILLGLHGRTGRWLQTYTALVGVSALLGLVMSGLLWVWPPDLEQEQLSLPAMFAYLGVVAWLLLAFGHILQQSLNLHARMVGVALALGFVLVSSLVTQLVLGLVAR
jgi:hypothetical protein